MQNLLIKILIGGIKMKFNEKLVMLRKQQNLSQEQVSEKLGVARQTVSKWELGETTPEMDISYFNKCYNLFS